MRDSFIVIIIVILLISIIPSAFLIGYEVPLFLTQNLNCKAYKDNVLIYLEGAENPFL